MNRNIIHAISGRQKPSPAVWDEFDVLMSAALDGQLDSQAALQFDTYLSEFPDLAEEWQLWRELDDRLAFLPSALPPDDFVPSFELRLLQRERRRKLWLGAGVGFFALSLSIGIVAGIVALASFVLFSQSDWLADAMHQLAYLSVTLASWTTALGGMADALLGSEQIRMAGVLYAGIAAAMVGGWTVLLHRTLRPVERTHPE